MHPGRQEAADWGREESEMAQPVGTGSPSEIPQQPRRKSLVPWKRGPTILLAEDDAELRRLIALMLRRDGYHVVECANGDAALDWLGDGVFDGYYERLPELIVSDVRLPYFDGLEILEAMREALTRVPIILITGFPDAELYRRAFALGARNVLAKPFELEELRAAVWLALRR
jgi:two-component system chemotaxis response regulator CheY